VSIGKVAEKTVKKKEITSTTTQCQVNIINEQLALPQAPLSPSRWKKQIALRNAVLVNIYFAI